jgi:sialic acid synthase SpsE
MPSIYTSLGAVALGSMMVEKHVTIDSNLKGPDDSVSISFHEIGRLVRGVQEIFEGLNSEKRLLESEVPIQSWARRSLVYLRDLPPGSILSRDDIWGKRPGTGIPAKYYEQFVGRTVKRAVKKDTLLNQEDLEV